MDDLGQQVGAVGGGEKRLRYWGASTGIGLVLPLAVYAISMYVAFGWREQLPNPVAIHWGNNGPDGFSSLESSLYLMLGIGLASNLLFWGLALALPTGRKILTATSLWLAVFLAAIQLGSLAIQRGLADAAEAEGVGGVFAVAFGISLLAAGIGFWLNPNDPPLPVTSLTAQSRPNGLSTEPSAIPTSSPTTESPSDLTWSTTVSSKVGFWVGASSILFTVLLPITMQEPWLLIMPVVLTLVFLAMLHFRVTIDHNGVEVRSVLGVPRTKVPLNEILHAQVTKTEAFGDFGGWGWRINSSGYTGIISRSGLSITVQRTGNRGLVITTPDAEAAVTTLNKLLESQHGDQR